MTTANPNQQYIRKASLLVLKQTPMAGISISFGGVTYNPPPETPVYESAIDLSELRFVFNTQNVDEEAPTNCSVRVFNLSENTREQLLSLRAAKIVVQAGYEFSYGVIFQGDIKQFRTGRIDNKDTFLDILAADGDKAYNFATSSASLEPSETTFDKLATRLINDLNLTKGYVPPPSTSKQDGYLPRGKVLYGMTRSFMRNLVFGSSSTWNIQNGAVNIVPLAGYIPGEAVVLNSATGLIGVPEQTQDGIKARCLLNPKIGVGSLVQIDQASITQLLSATHPIPRLQNVSLVYNLKTIAGQRPLVAVPSIARDGFYKVNVAEHTGDTRGQEWYTDLICIAYDASSGNVVQR